MGKKSKHVLIALGFSLLFFVALGIPTVLIPTGFFVRMIPPTIIDYALLALTSGLAGSYASYSLYLKSREEKSNYAALGGVFSGIFGFGCPICNSLLVALFGTTTLLLLFEPVRYFLGIVTVALFALAFYLKARAGKCRKC